MRHHFSIELFRSGDKKYFEYVFILFYRRLLVNAAHYLGGDWITAEDVVSSAFESLWLRRSTMNDLTHIENHLYMFARFTVLDLRKSAWKKRTITVGEHREDSLVDYPSPPSDLSKLMTVLTKRSREVIELKYLQGLSLVQIAAHLNISADAAFNAHKRGLAALKNHIKL